MTFNKVEVTSHYSILGVEVRERLPKVPDLFFLCTCLIRRMLIRRRENPESGSEKRVARACPEREGSRGTEETEYREQRELGMAVKTPAV